MTVHETEHGRMNIETEYTDPIEAIAADRDRIWNLVKYSRLFTVEDEYLRAFIFDYPVPS